MTDSDAVSNNSQKPIANNEQQAEPNSLYLRHMDLHNFRSCSNTSVTFQPDLTVLVGENATGKSALIDGLRLTTFSENEDRPLSFETERDRSNEIGQDGITSIDLSFTNLSLGQRATFLPQLVDEDLNLRYNTDFSNDPDLPYWERATRTTGLQRVPDSNTDIRHRISHIYLPPLRDAVREIDGMGGNRLARVLSVLTDGDKESNNEFINSANNLIAEIAKLDLPRLAEKNLTRQFSRLTPAEKKFSVNLSGRKASLQRLARDLRLELLENGVNPTDMASSGLGYANLLYMATIVLQLTEVAHYDLTLLLVEEPEAHLHPQLQATLLDYLKTEAKQSQKIDDENTLDPAGRLQVIVTTHSPNITSAVSINNIDIVHKTAEENDSVGQSPASTKVIALKDLGLEKKKVKKLDRYLNVTRSSLLFARKVCLVEGIAEAVLIPALAHRCFLYNDTSSSFEFRKAAIDHALSSITIIPIDGVDFTPYLDLLLKDKDCTPRVDQIVVFTDGDLKVDENGEQSSPGIERVKSLRQKYSKFSESVLTIHNGDTTLEAELFSYKENEKLMKNAFLQQHPNSQERWEKICKVAGSDTKQRALSFSDALHGRGSETIDLGKGDFAQDLAEELDSKPETPFTVPEYLKKGIAELLDPLFDKEHSDIADSSEVTDE